MKRGNVIRMHAYRSRKALRRGRLPFVSVVLLTGVAALSASLDPTDLASRIQSILVLQKPIAGGQTDERLEGRVTHVRDGDTVVVRNTPVRLANLDCAERGTVQGERATRRMKELAATGHLLCRLEGRKSYDREVGLCALPSGRDVGEILIAEGQCRRWR